MHRKCLLSLFIFSVILFSTPALGNRDELEWKAHARRLTGESTRVRLNAIHALKNISGLEDLLRKEVTESRFARNRFLALDVISTLKLVNLRPILVSEALNDQTGFYYLTLNSLADYKSSKELNRIYVERLEDSHTPAVSKVILLDTLARTHSRLNADILKRFLLVDRSPEVRNSAIHYLRSFILKKIDFEYLKLLRATLEDRKISIQRKTQALFLASEIPIRHRRWISSLDLDCSGILASGMKKFCEAIQKRPGL